MMEDVDTSRRVERGARLVVCVGHSVVLQMPRGNLETIEPRALTLVSAATLLDSGDYAAVAKLLRRCVKVTDFNFFPQFIRDGCD
jgi:elongator complex protein 1